MGCDLKHENALRRRGIEVVAGIDEAGRGPLAGPVVAAAVILPARFRRGILTDSKKLTPEQRETLFTHLTTHPQVCWAVAEVDHRKIDEINILRASHLAMRLAVQRLRLCPAHVLIDGLPVNPFPHPQTALVKGDSRSLSIAAASVIAKVTRDRLMIAAHTQYPQYGFAQHKGYATREHLRALEKHGPCPIHRNSFAPVAQGHLALEIPA